MHFPPSLCQTACFNLAGMDRDIGGDAILPAPVDVCSIDDGNEFGLPRRDTYYHDIDVSTGYASSEMWVLIPKTAP